MLFPLKTTVLPDAIVPMVGFVAFAMVNVALLDILTVPVTAKPDGIVKEQALVPFPTTIVFVPTDQAAVKAGMEAAFLRLKV